MLSLFFHPTVPEVFINELGEHILNRNGVIHLPSDNTVTSGTALPSPYTWQNPSCLSLSAVRRLLALHVMFLCR